MTSEKEKLSPLYFWALCLASLLSLVVVFGYIWSVTGGIESVLQSLEATAYQLWQDLMATVTGSMKDPFERYDEKTGGLFHLPDTLGQGA